MTLEEIKDADEMTLRNRLAELRGIKRTRKLTPDEVEEGQVRAAANKMMEFDPGSAIGWMQRADQLKSKRVEQTPEAVRFKIQSALNANNQELSAYVQRNGASPTDAGYTDRVKLINALKKELTSDTPSLQRAYLVAQGVEPPADNAPTGGEVPDYNSLVAELSAAKKLGYAEKVKALESIATKMPNVQLSEAQRSALAQAIKSAMKEGKPTEGTGRPKETSTDVRATIQAALAELSTLGTASRADITNPTGRQMVFKVAQRAVVPEAVNEGDVQNASSIWQKLAQRLGAPVALSDDQINQSVSTIKEKYNSVSNLLRQYTSDKYAKSVSDATVANIEAWLNEYPLGGFGAATPARSATTRQPPGTQKPDPFGIR